MVRLLPPQRTFVISETMTFWGIALKPGQKKQLQVPEAEILHLSQVCLQDPKDGKNYLQVTVEGKTFNVVCLEKGKKEHETVDLFFGPDDTHFSNKGQSELHLLGYLEPHDEEDDDEEDKKPAAGQKAAATKASPKVEAKTSPKIEAKSSPKVEAKSSPKVEAKMSPKVAPKAAAAADDDDDDDIEEEGEEEELVEESEEEEGDESEEEAPKKQATPQGKRKAEQAPAASPASKKQKEAASPAPAAANPNLEAYVQKLHKYLKDNGKSNLGALGSKVQRPEGVPKMKVVIEKHPEKFSISGDQVTAK